MLALTHVHPDHQGVAKDVCEARGVPLACHADDVDAMEGRRPVAGGGAEHPVNRVIRAIWAGPAAQGRPGAAARATRSPASASSTPPATPAAR